MRPSLPSTFAKFRELWDHRPPWVHPNGFIQLDLTEVYRLHVWHPALPYRQRTYHPIHSHVFDFTSHVYSGRLVNATYDLEPNPRGAYVVWRVQATEETESILQPVDGERMRLVPSLMRVLQAGETYDFGAYRFHEILFNEPTLTVIEKRCPPYIWLTKLKTGVNSRGASVAVPVGVEPDNDFRRDTVDVDVLWDLIGEAYP